MDANLLYLLSWVIIGVSAIFYILLQVIFRKYFNEPNSLGLTGKELVELLNKETGYGVTIKEGNDFLGDYYNPKNNSIVLSKQVYSLPSITSIGVSAHEYGHAIQKNTRYPLMFLRNFLVYYANIGTTLGFWLAFIGILIGAMGLAKIGLFLYAGIVLFTFFTMPVEFDASRRALKILKTIKVSGKQLSNGELDKIRLILGLAGFTYVISFMSSLINFLYLLSLAKERD